MKKLINKRGIVLLLLVLLTGTETFAQSTTTRRRRTNAGNNNSQQSLNNNAVVNPATGNAVTPPPADTSITGNSGISQRPDNIFGMQDTTRKSLRTDGIVERNLDKDRTPLSYQYIREDDAVWGKRIWREIDTREKMNLPFRYEAENDNGSQLFINILLKSVMDSQVVAFDPIDDRFTTPMSINQVNLMLHGKPDTIRVIDPITNQETVKVIRNDFNPNDVMRYRLKEDWVFDKQTSTMYVRIIGIAPLRIIRNADGSERAETPMFWLYYPDLRPILTKYDVYNPRNYSMRMSWEDLFEIRYFSSYIVKEDNPYDRSIKDYIKSGVGRLLEGQKIKSQIFNYEQNLWSY